MYDIPVELGVIVSQLSASESRQLSSAGKNGKIRAIFDETPKSRIRDTRSTIEGFEQ